MNKHILVAIDGSETGHQSLEKTAKLAKEQRCVARLASKPVPLIRGW